MADENKVENVKAPKISEAAQRQLDANRAKAEVAEAEAKKHRKYTLISQQDMLLAEVICALVDGAEVDMSNGTLIIPLKKSR